MATIQYLGLINLTADLLYFNLLFSPGVLQCSHLWVYLLKEPTSGFSGLLSLEINTREARLLDPPRNLTSGLGPLYRDLLPAPLLVIYTRWSSSACRPGNSRLLIAGFIRNKDVNRVGFYVLCSLRPSLSPLLPLSPSLSLILSLP